MNLKMRDQCLFGYTVQFEKKKKRIFFFNNIVFIRTYK